MHGIRAVLLGVVMLNALVALVLWLWAVPMPGWFAAVLVLGSLALAGSRVIERQFSNKRSA
jgi:hypothetical protein